MEKIAFLFAGQGAQYPGMGKDFYEKYDFVKDLYKKASETLGYDLTKMCFEQNELLNQTIYTQPSILVTSLSMYYALLHELNIKPDAVAGFSLGEYSALHASGIFDYSTIVYLIKQRALFMNEAAKSTNGAMAAVIGMDKDVLANLCQEITNEVGLVQIANYNCPNQLVCGGLREAVNTLCERAKQNGAKRALMLNVSGGFHTPLMSEAAFKMFDVINSVTINEPKIPIIMNCNADYLKVEQLPDLMKKQIESSVYFEDTISKMIQDGVTTFIEIGPGNVLSGFIKKIDNTIKVFSIDKVSDLENLKEVL